MAKRHLSYEVDYGTTKIPDPKGADYINKFTQRFYTSLSDWTAKNNPLEKFPLFNNDEILKAGEPDQAAVSARAGLRQRGA